MSQTLPATAYIKMIDIWMIFTMLYPFAEIALVWTKDFFKKRAVTKQGDLSVLIRRENRIGQLYINRIFCLGPNLVSILSEREKSKRRIGTIEPLNDTIEKPLNGTFEKSKRDDSTFAKAWAAFSNLESFCKSPLDGSCILLLFFAIFEDQKPKSWCLLSAFSFSATCAFLGEKMQN